ncbi:MAG: MBL fold metallo-hydrolase [Bacteroidota bacterium]|nr:MBL fold metallo-hydrolase [Bacteroidota bacterium]
MSSKHFTIHSIRGFIETIFLVEYNEKLLLLDGGAKPDVEIIENFILQKLNRPMSDLKLIISTHMHPDHAGAATFLRKKHNIPIAAHTEADEWYSGFRGFIQQKFDIFLASYVVRKKNNTKKDFKYPRKINADYLLKDGDLLPFFNDWKIIHAPGHTSHMFVVYNQSEKTLYAADVLLVVNKKCKLPFPVELKVLGEQTLLKLSKLEIKTLLLAHGGKRENINTKQKFLDLIPKLKQKYKFPMKLLIPFTSNNYPLKNYRKIEKKIMNN